MSSCQDALFPERDPEEKEMDRRRRAIQRVDDLAKKGKEQLVAQLYGLTGATGLRRLDKFGLAQLIVAFETRRKLES